MEVSEAAYEISCPDSECEKQEGKIQMSEIEILVGSELFEKHKSFRLDTGKFFSGTLELEANIQ